MIEVDARSLEVKHNVPAHRFEVQLGDKLGLIDYRKTGLTYNLYHTEVPPEYEGQGIANRLAFVALEAIRNEGGHVVPGCRFIQVYIRRHKEYAPLVVST